MLARADVIGPLVIGLWSLLAIVSVWGAGGGAVGALVAIVLAWAALTEPTSRRVRRAAFIGVGASILALLGGGVLLVLAVLGL